MITQLNPQLSVVVLKDGKWIKGYAFAILDYSQDHDLMFIIALDDTGEIWIVPNDEVRMENNWSLKRRIKKE